MGSIFSFIFGKTQSRVDNKKTNLTRKNYSSRTNNSRTRLLGPNLRNNVPIHSNVQTAVPIANIPIPEIHSNEQIAKRIAPIFGFSEPETIAFMNALHNRGSITPFFDKLPKPPIQIEDDVTSITKKSKIHVNNRNSPPRYIYKIIKIDIMEYKKNEDIRNILMEAFIQAVLCTDSEVGQNICKLIHVYKDISVYPMKIILQMEYLQMTLNDYLRHSNIQTQMIRIILPNLYSTFNILKRKYKYENKDVHFGNFMIHNEVIKMIDFGIAQIIINTDVYATGAYLSLKRSNTTTHSELYSIVSALQHETGKSIFKGDYKLLKTAANDNTSNSFLRILKNSDD